MLSKKNVYLILIAIVLLGAVLRLYHLGNNSFASDEFLDINSTYAYFKTHQWQNWDFNFGKVNTENIFQARDERAWIYKWQVAELFKFFPPTESVARSVSALWGIASIILMYFAGTYFSKKKEIGLLSAFLFAVGASGIEFDRKLRMYAMFFPVYLSFSWLMFGFLEEKYTGKIKQLAKIGSWSGLNFIYLIPALVLGIVSFLTHQLTVNIIAVLAIYLVINLVLAYRRNKELKNKYAVLSGLGIVGVIGAFVAFPGQINTNLKELQFFNNHFEYFLIVLQNYSQYLLAAIFLALGVYFILKKQKLEKEGIWLAASFFVPLIMAVFIWSQNIGNQYIFFIESFGIIFVASGIYYAAQFFKEKMPFYKNKAFIAAIVLALLILPNYGYFFQKDNTYKQTSSSDNPNYRKIFAYFKKARNSGDVLVTRNFRNYYWSGAKVKVYDFGGELSKEKLSLTDIKNISTENPSGWFIISDNDESYISNDAITYAEKNFEKISNVQVRGKVSVFRWDNQEE